MTQHIQGRYDHLRAEQDATQAEFRAESARAFNPQGASLTGPSVAFGADPELPKAGVARMFLRSFMGGLPVVGPAARLAMDVFPDKTEKIIDNTRGAARGLIGGVDAGLESLIGLEGQFLKSTGLGEFFGGEAFLDWFDQDSDDRNVLHIGKDRIAVPQTIIGSLTEGLFQFGVGMLGVGKVMTGVRLGRGALAGLTSGKAIGKTLTMGKSIPKLLARIGNSTVGKWLKPPGRLAKTMTRGMVIGGVIDATFFDPQEERLSNLITSSPQWFGAAITDYLATTDAVQFMEAKPEDDEALGRFKNVLEGVILGGMVGTVAHAVNVQKLRWTGAKEAAADLAARFMPQPVHGIVELPNGKWRLSQHAGDKAMLTEWQPRDVPLTRELTDAELDGPLGPVGTQSQSEILETLAAAPTMEARALEGLDVIPLGDEGVTRTFLYDTPMGKGGVTGHIEGGEYKVARMGRADPLTGKIDINQKFEPGMRGSDRLEASIKEEFPKLVEDFENGLRRLDQSKELSPMSHEKAIKAAEDFSQSRREFETRSQLDTDFQNSLTEPEMMTLGAELYSYMPEITHIEGFRVKADKVFRYPVARLRQEIFSSRGDAGIEALSASDGRSMANAPIAKLSETQFSEVVAIGDLYAKNRTHRTIRKAEDAWVRTLRTNMASGANDIGAIIADMAGIFHKVDPNGNSKVMRARGDNALSLIKSKDMAGILENPLFAGLNPVAVRHAAGLMMKSLGSDIVRYTRRTQQGGSNLSYLQLGRALDQMIHVEELLTGKPAVWFDRHKRLYEDGAFGNAPEAKVSNIDVPEPGTVRERGNDSMAREINDELAAESADDVGPGGAATEEAAGLAREGAEDAAQARQAEFDQPGGVNDPMGPPAPPEHMLAGNAPGPKSLRNLSKGEIQRLGQMIALADGDPSAILVALKSARLAAISQARGGAWKNALLRYRISGMLSGFTTHAVNVVSTGLQTGLKPAELMIGGTLTGQPKYIIEGAYRLQGMISEAGDAWRASTRAYKTGQGNLDAGFMTQEFDAGRFEGMMKFANVPQDFLTSADEFFKVMNYRSDIRARSLTSSLLEGLDPAQTARRMISDLEASVTADGTALNQAALEYSRNATFTDAMGPRMASVTGLLRGDKLNGDVGKLFIPYIRTPHNIAVNIVVRSPLAMVNMKAHLAAVRNGGREAAERMGRMATAAALVGTAGLLIEQNRITGRGPMHPVTRAAWKAAGNEPYTIIDGNGEKIHYNRLSPLFGPMAIIADAWMASGNMKNAEEVQIGIMQVTASLLSYVSDQGFVGNAGEMMEVIIGGDGGKISAFVKQTTTNMLVPRAISQFTAFDDSMREAEGYVEEIMKLTPGLSAELPPERNIFREAILKAPGSWGRLLNPFTSMGIQDTEVAMALFRVGKNMSLPGDTKFDGRIELRDTDQWGEVDGMSPYEHWLEGTAHPNWKSTSLKEDLSDLVHGAYWRSLSPGSEDWPGGPRFEAVARLVQTSQDIAWQNTLLAFPDLQKMVIDETVLKSLGRFGGKDATDAYQESLNRQ